MTIYHPLQAPPEQDHTRSSPPWRSCFFFFYSRARPCRTQGHLSRQLLASARTRISLSTPSYLTPTISTTCSMHMLLCCARGGCKSTTIEEKDPLTHLDSDGVSVKGNDYFTNDYFSMLSGGSRVGTSHQCSRGQVGDFAVI